MRIGLAGAGRMGAFHAEVLAANESVDDIVVADIDDERAAALAASVGGSVANETAAMLDEGIDALVIAAPTPWHAPLIHMGIDAGVPVFCEKPIALDLDSTNAVVEHVQAAGAYVQIGFNRRFDPGFLAAREAVASGALGTLYAARMGTHDPAPPPMEYLAASGGVFRDMHIHDFDALRFVTGDEVERVYADGSVLVDPAIGDLGDVDTTGVVLHLEGGAIVVMSGCRADPRGYDVRVELFGSNDSVTMGIESRTPLRSVDDGGLLGGDQGWDFFIDRFDQAYRDQMRAFVRRAATGDGSNPCTVHDAREALLIAIAAERSRAEGRAVTMAEVRSEAVSV